MCNMIKADEIDFSIKYHPRREVFVVKKDGTLSPFNINKVIKAIGKSAYRALTKFTVEEQEYICQKIINRVDDMDTDKVHIQDMHNMVEQALDDVKPAVAKSYRDYRNYKQDFVVMMDDIYKKAQSIMFIGDKENANSDSALVSTKRALIFNQINKELYQKFFMTTEELQACRDGYIYIHDMSSRRDTMNCFRRDTRFITKDGIKSFYDFSDGDMTMVLSHKGIWRRAIVHKYGWQRIQKVTIGKQSYKSNPFEIYCTPNHRWILQDGTVTENLKIGDKLWQVPDITTFNWNDLTLENKKLWCKGFAKGDGSLADQGTSRPPYVTIRLCGNKVRYAPYFQDCGYSVTKVANIDNDLFVHMLDTTSKDIPWLSLDYTNIIYYINGLMCADGNRRITKNPTSEYRGIQVTGELNKDIYDLLNIAGYYVTNMRNLTGQSTNYGIRNKETISYGVSSCQIGSAEWRVWNIEPAELNPKAEVWCLEVEEDHSFLLEGGIPTGNCCLCDISTILMGGFEMGNVWYNEPNSLDTAFDVIGDVTLSAASQQYGGFTLPEIDKVLEPYAQKSYDKYVEELKSYGLSDDRVEEIALKKLEREFDQGFQGWEYKFNTVGSSRGDYPFITASFGLSTTRFGKMCNKSILRVRAGGQGKEGFKKPVLFPKLIFLYDENLHGEGKECEDVFLAGIECSSKTMYPDYISLSGKGYISETYQSTGRAISAMGCTDANEIVTYKFNGRLYVESIGRMWDKMAFIFPIKEQRYEGDPNLYIELQEVYIYDTNLGDFTYCNKIIRNISDKWFDVSFTGGRRVLVTNDHPFEVIGKGVVRAENLQMGDQILANYSQYSEEKFVVDPEYAWTLGFMLCDGCYQNYSVFASIAATGEDEIEERFKVNMAKYFGAKIVTVNQNRGPKGTYKDLRAKSQGNNEISTMINEFSDIYGGVNKVKRQIPNEVFEWNYASKLAFLAGMIDADGYINDGVGYNNQSQYITGTSSYVQLGSTNKELALQQMALAQSLGMPCKMYHNHYTKRNPEAVRYQIYFEPSVDLCPWIACAKKKKKCHITPITFLDQPIEESRVYSPVVSVNGLRPVFKTDYSYDVSTDSEHFEVSGIYSHNCRAFLSPWYEKGGLNPADENDKPVFVGRANIGVVSLHLPMILAKSRQENRDFYEVLDYYLEMIRQLHLRTYEYLGEMRASTNPLMYCMGGFYGGNLDFHDKIKPVLNSFTASFGITALNELNRLYNGKSIAEDGEFPLEVMKHINDKINEYKHQDGRLYAIYGTPAESLCSLQVKQFRAKYGIIENVSDREYVSNSFHCHVSEDITPIQKQDLEEKFWDYFNGGKIQYVRYPIPYNKEAIISLVRRAMKIGYYEGVNMSLAYCDDCGHQELEMDVCPVCGSRNLTKIDRMNGYLAYSRVHGDTRLNAGKMAEIAERRSM